MSMLIFRTPKWIYIFALVAILCSITVFGEESSSLKAIELAKKNLDEKNIIIRELFQSLQKSAKQPNLSNEQEDVIRLLGEFKATEAIEELVARISFVTSRPIDERTIKNVYPAISALTRIGKPATDPLLNAIIDCGDKEKIRLYVYTLKDIETAPVAVFLLENRIKELKEITKTNNLQTALKITRENHCCPVVSVEF